MKRLFLSAVLASMVLALGLSDSGSIRKASAQTGIEKQWYEASYNDFDDGIFRETVLSGPGTAADIRLGPFNQWYNEFWEFRRAILIDNRDNPNSLTNYQLKIEVPYWEGTNPNFADIRFTSQNGITIYEHWKEKFTAASAAVFWVNVPFIQALTQTKIYIYYSNLGTGDTSDGEATFVLFDDFNDDEIDTDKWTVQNSTITEQDGFLRLAITSAAQQPGISSNFTLNIPNQIVLERSIRLNAENEFFTGNTTISDFSGILAAIRYSYDFNPDDGVDYTNRDSFFVSTSVDDSSTPLYPFWNNTWFDEMIIFDGLNGNLTYLRDNNATQETIDYEVNTTDQNILFRISPSGSGLSHYIDVDNIRVRRYSEIEPKVDPPGVEQTESFGAYVTKGTYSSGVFDTLASGSTVDSMVWNESIPAGTAIAMEMRASDNQFEADDPFDPPWTTVTNGSDPPLAGRFIQYRSTLSGTGVFSSELEDVLIDYTIISPISPSLNISTGLYNPPPTNEQSNASDVETIQLEFTAGYAEPIKITGITFTANGTGEDSTEIVADSVRLYQDEDMNGLLDDTVDTLIGTGSFLEDNGTLAFNGLSVIVNQDSSKFLILVVDFAGTATFGDTFTTNIASRLDVDATGMISLEPALVTGDFPIYSSVKTISTMGSFSIALGSGTPSSQTVANDAVSIPVMQISIQTGSVEGVQISGIKFTGTGTGNDAQDIKPNGCWLVLDSNGNGAVDDNEYQIGYNQSYTTDNGTITFTMSEQIPVNGSAKWILMYTFSGNGTGATTFEASMMQATDVTATGLNSFASITPDGTFPVTSGTISLSDTLIIPTPVEPVRVRGSQSAYCFLAETSSGTGLAAMLAAVGLAAMCATALAYVSILTRSS